MSIPAGGSRGAEASIDGPLFVPIPDGPSHGAEAADVASFSDCDPLNDTDVCCSSGCGPTCRCAFLDSVDVLELIEQMSESEAKHVLVKLSIEHPHLDLLCCDHIYSNVTTLIVQMSETEAKRVLVRLSDEHPHLDWWNLVTFYKGVE